MAAAMAFGQAEDPGFATYLAAERALLPTDGELLYDCSVVSGYSGGTRFDVEDSDVPFERAYRVKVNQTGANPWEPQFQTPRNAIPVRNGDMLYWVFYAKTIEAEQETGQAKGTFYAQKAESPWTTIVSHEITPGSDWTRYHVFSKVTDAYAEGEMGVTIHLGYFRQTIELGGFLALNLGQGIDPADLPAIKTSYVGREADASWRAPAAERIEQLRKGDLTVHVINGDGDNVKDATVDIEMLEHAFHFGNFVSSVILDNTSDAANYEDHFLTLFNAATTPFYMGDGNWGWYKGEQARQQYQDMAAWLQDQSMHTKGHVLIWPGWQWLPPHIKALENDTEGLREALLEHLDEVVPIGRDFGLAQWDVMNEPYSNHDLMDILGEEEISAWYNRVHELHPDAKLILNETNVVSNGGNSAVQDNLARIVELLQDAGAALHGIGFQGHFGSSLTSPQTVLEILDRFSTYGLPLQVTEFDVDIDDEEAQADYTRDFLTAIFSHPAMEKFIMWGFWETVQWKPRGCMVRSDWTIKPNYDAYMDLVFDQWWTDEAGLSNRTGEYNTRGFLGAYKITVSKDGEEKTVNLNLTRDGASVQITLPNATTSVSNDANSPQTLDLSRNFPNPFNPSTRIDYQIPGSGFVSIDVFDISGKKVRSLVQTVQNAGDYSTVLDGSDLASGVYFVRLSLGNQLSQKIKMILMK